MELVGTALCLVEDVAAEDVPVLRGGISRNDLHLINRIDAGVVTGNVVESLINVDTVKQVLIYLLTIPVDRNGRVCADRSRDSGVVDETVGVGADRAGQKGGQCDDIAANERHVFNRAR